MKALSLFSDLKPKRVDLRPIKRSGRRSQSEFANRQALTLIRKYPGTSVYGIFKKAQEEMPKFYSSDKRDYDKILNAINRLENDGKITSEIVVSGSKACRILTIP